MKTELLVENTADIDKAAELIKSGELVGIPTETVYGLAADACNPKAVAKIFAAKGRPADNPLIVHIADTSMLSELAENIPDIAYRLADKFWPGPLTMIFKKKFCIPEITSGGLDTVGIRKPAHSAALALIRSAGIPLAAPSGNISGYPSPTKAEHMMRDMNGKIPAVIDGGECSIGVESTVISFENENTVRILRPGGVTREDLLEITDNVIIDPAILHELEEGQIVRSPGMKYKHYSPNAHIIMLEGKYDNFCDYVNAHSGAGVYSLIFDDDDKMKINVPAFSYGCDSSEQAHSIFSCMREMDSLGADIVYVRAPKAEGVGLAVYNRLIRAAGFEVIQV
ncbi:MAG: threonylcarbamoyl-AMP synthase [Ruminococcus sp.]|nr:threonylcarbamoyl-AMP synthase [Ruminococcus sp.]